MLIDNSGPERTEDSVVSRGEIKPSDKATSPGAQLVLAAPNKVPKLLVVGVVVVLDSVEQRRRDFHQRVVGQLLLLAAGVAVVQVVHFVGDL